ncbi:ribonuclease H-like domain-containing protein [Tanacetum coccineum]
MVTHAQIGTDKPNPCFNFHTSHISPIPKSPTIPLSDPNWRVAMYDEYNALVKNNTWILVLKPPNANVLSRCGCLDISIMLMDLRVGTRLDLLPMAALTGMFMSQNKYTLELLDKAHMANCNPTRMPIDTESKLDSIGILYLILLSIAVLREDTDKRGWDTLSSWGTYFGRRQSPNERKD